VIFSNHKYYLVDKVSKKTLVVGIEDHGIFRWFDAKEAKESALMAKSGQNSSELWHQWYGHLNFISISFLAKESLVDGLPDI
jgi:hypothetical protein